MPRNKSPVNFKDRTHFRLVITTSTNSFQNGWCKSKRLGPGALFRAHWTPGPAFTYTCSPTVCIRKRSKLLFTNQRERFMGMEDGGRQLEETICSSSKKPTSKWLFTRGESAFNRVSVLLSTKTKIFLDKIKKDNNGKRRGRKKADSVPNRNLSFPYDILACRKIKKHQWGSLNYLTRPKIKISYSMVRAELSGIERHLFPVIIKSVIFFV